MWVFWCSTVLHENGGKEHKLFKSLKASVSRKKLNFITHNYCHTLWCSKTAIMFTLQIIPLHEWRKTQEIRWWNGIWQENRLVNESLHVKFKAPFKTHFAYPFIIKLFIIQMLGNKFGLLNGIHHSRHPFSSWRALWLLVLYNAEVPAVYPGLLTCIIKPLKYCQRLLKQVELKS